MTAGKVVGEKGGEGSPREKMLDSVASWHRGTSLSND